MNRIVTLVVASMTVVSLYCWYFAHQAFQRVGWEYAFTKWVGEHTGFLAILLAALMFGGIAFWQLLKTISNLTKEQILKSATAYNYVLASLSVLMTLLSLLDDSLEGKSPFGRICMAVFIVFLLSLERIYGGWDKLVDRWI